MTAYSRAYTQTAHQLKARRKKNENRRKSNERKRERTENDVQRVYGICVEKPQGSNISNTRNSVSSGYPDTEKIGEKCDAQRSIFDQIRGVWIADETLSRVFDISSQSTQKRKSKRKSKIVKIYAN